MTRLAEDVSRDCRSGPFGQSRLLSQPLRMGLRPSLSCQCGLATSVGAANHHWLRRCDDWGSTPVMARQLPHLNTPIGSHSRCGNAYATTLTVVLPVDDLSWMVLAWSHETRTQPWDSNLAPTRCELWKPIFLPWLAKPVNQPIPAFFPFVWHLSHLMPTWSFFTSGVASFPPRPELVLGEHGQVSDAPDVKVTTRL